jgi:CheY-like chemotaxis protein
MTPLQQGQEDSAPLPRGDSPTGGTDGRSAWIMVVAEDRAYRELLHEAIGLSGPTAQRCVLCDADAALLMCRHAKTSPSSRLPEVIVLDLEPVRRRRFIRHLRANTHTARLPIALLLPSDDPKVVLACQEPETLGYVVKPDTLLELGALLSDLGSRGTHRLQRWAASAS